MVWGVFLRHLVGTNWEHSFSSVIGFFVMGLFGGGYTSVTGYFGHESRLFVGSYLRRGFPGLVMGLWEM